MFVPSSMLLSALYLCMDICKLSFLIFGSMNLMFEVVNNNAGCIRDVEEWIRGKMGK